MKRKILLWIKQKLCRHQYEFVECDYISYGFGNNPYFMYRCSKCNKYTIIKIDDITSELSKVNPEKSLMYPKETLWLPEYYILPIFKSARKKYESREVGYLVSKYYNKYGILLTAWGNREFGPKIDHDNLEVKSHDEMVYGIKSGDGLPPLC